ncbi:MAG: hypothetical protein AAGJ94_01340 [Pseudomonadota bacterium]
MKDVYIHIGPHKTGSTTIQHFLMGNTDLLRKRDDLHVCTTGRVWKGQNINLAWQFVNKDRREKDGGSWEDLTAEINASDSSKFIVTSETFSRLRPKHVSTIATFLSGYNVYVIFYARRPEDRLHSRYTQLIKNMNEVDTPENYVTRMLSDDLISEIHNILAVWADVFGDDAIKLRVQEKSQLVGGDLVSDFCDAVGVGLDGSEFYPERELNVSPGPKSLEMLRQLGIAKRKSAPTAKWWVLYEMYGARILSYGGKKGWNDTPARLFSADLLRTIRDHFRQQEEWAAQRFLGRRDGLLFRERQPIEEIEYHNLDDYTPTKTELLTFICHLLEMRARGKAKGQK